jgi:hypothetical protein
MSQGLIAAARLNQLDRLYLAWDAAVKQMLAAKTPDECERLRLVVDQRRLEYEELRDRSEGEQDGTT